MENVTEQAFGNTIYSALTESRRYVVVGPVACVEKILLDKPLGQCHTIDADIRSAEIEQVLASGKAAAHVAVRGGRTACALTL